MQTKSQQERAGKSHYIFKEIYICHEHLLVLNPNQNFKYRWPPSKGGFFHGRDDMKQLMAGGGIILLGTTLIPLLSGLF